MMAFTLVTSAQNMTQLWQQVENANKKDLPREEIKVLQQIADKAKAGRQYGNLLKAEVKLLDAKGRISPDSIQPAIERLDAQMTAQKDEVLKAVYCAVLGRVCGDEERAKEYTAQALANPKLLAKTKAEAYGEIIEKGVDSGIFDNDLLSVVGISLDSYDAMHDYYVSVGNRRAACLSAMWLLERSGRNTDAMAAALDSLLTEYGDLDVAGEVAAMRLQYKIGENTPKERIEFVRSAISRWGSWKKGANLLNAEKQLINPQFRVNIERNQVRPDEAQKIKLEDIRNIKQLTLKIYKLGVNGDTRLSPTNTNDLKQLQAKARLLTDKTIVKRYDKNGQGEAVPEYELQSDEFELCGLPVGVYMIEASADDIPAVRSLYYVSDVFCIGQSNAYNRMRYAVVSATTGQPLPGAKISIFVNRNGTRQLKTTLTCDAKGEVYYDSSGDYSGNIHAYTDTDKAAAASHILGSYYFYNNTKPMEQTFVMTDKALYRPGQIVKMAAVVYENKNNVDNTAVAGKSVTAVLRDANNKVLAEKTLTTDEFGKVSAEFSLPVNSLNGIYSIRVNGAGKSIRVEEYKRPAFTVEFDEVKTSYAIGDTVMLKGRAMTYSGVPVQGAKVSYTIGLKVPFWRYVWNMYHTEASSYSGKLLETGTTMSDENGEFTIAVPISGADANDGIMPLRTMFNIEVNADVTDMAGETHNAVTLLPLSAKQGMLVCDLNEQYLADNLKTITFRYLNALGNNVEKQFKWGFDGEDMKTAVTDGKSIDISAKVKALKSGKHTLLAICEGDTLKQEFTIFRLTDKSPAEYTRSFFYQSAERFARDGSPLTIMLGSSDNDVHVFYSIVSGSGEKGKILEEGTFDISNQYYTRSFKYLPEYGNGIAVSLAWVKDGKCYSYNTNIERPEPDNKLTMQWTTFRDRLSPGQKEEWTLSVKKSDGTPADAQLMATMFDKSLDQLMRYDATFLPINRLTLPMTHWISMWAYPINWWRAKEMKYVTVESPKFSQFYNWVTSPSLFMRRGGILTRNTMMKARGAMLVADAAADMAVEEESVVMMSAKQAAPAYQGLHGFTAGANEAGAEAPVADFDDGASPQGEQVQMRENLNETAFFYPALHTDNDGNITIKFTLPEALTTWRFLGIAHTKDIAVGMLEGEAVAQKEVMVQPNMPRFVRVGDKAQIQARIVNLSELQKSGTATIQLIDPATESVVYTQSTEFAVEAGKTTVATFDYEPTEDAPALLVCKIMASGDGFGDGEQHYLPILPRKERVTKTVTFTQTEPGTKTIDIAKMFETSDKARLTVEYTNNPAWLVVQALPQMATPHNDCSVCQATALYSNTLGQHIASKVPALRSLIAQWNMESGAETSLMGNLAKDGELKDIILNETPWLNDADSEADQRRMLGTYFDENLMEMRKSAAVENLRNLQKDDGSWGWMPRMEGSSYMTTTVADMLVRLNTMTGSQSTTRDMLDKALRWLDKEAVKEVAELKKQQKKRNAVVFPSRRMLQYLYLRSLDNSNVNAETRAAIDYLMPLLKKEIKKQSMYEKAMTAVILQKQGETKLAKEYLQSLKEYTVYKEDMGRYFDTPRAEYSWRDYRIPTQAMAIVALQAIAPDDRQTLAEMQRWLLQEKRTQAWDTPLNSVDAIYAFLCDNSLSTNVEPARITIDGKLLEMPQATAGIGYQKTSMEGTGGATLAVEKTSGATSWGSVYAQFMKPATDVSASGTELSVKREVLVIDGDKRRPLSASDELTVGDRVVVRITITAGRDLDFVQVSDRRAACMEPVTRLSGYKGYHYETPKDNRTDYFFDRMAKGRHVVETEYYIDRAGTYASGTCIAECAYSPEFRAVDGGSKINVK